MPLSSVFMYLNVLGPRSSLDLLLLHGNISFGILAKYTSSAKHIHDEVLEYLEVLFPKFICSLHQICLLLVFLLGGSSSTSIDDAFSTNLLKNL